MTQSADLRGRTIADRYVIDREVGRGAMAVVYRARDKRYKRDIALKILNSELSSSLGPDRFIHEIELVARLNHPHIVSLYDSGEADGLLYYVMPFIEGSTLGQRLEKAGKIPTAEAVRIIQQVASALDYAHEAGIVHRDIKPDNIMFHQGEAVVTDFGIGMALTAAADDRLTLTGTALGTPAYMSPEQVAGADNIDARSDQYSLACVLYEMLAGVPPFTGKSAQATMAKRLTETPPRIRSVVAEVPDIISRALSRGLSLELSDRFATTGEFATALAGGVAAAESETLQTRRSVAVLPFTTSGSDPDNEYFAEGVAEEIINALTKVEVLDVASRTSAFAFGGQKHDVLEIGRKLGVGLVLEGSVRRAGLRLRISAQLIDVDSGYQLWSERYDRELADVFAIQDEIADSIVKALRIVLTPSEARAVRSVPAKDIRAYEYYLRGRQLFNQNRKAGHHEAIEWYRRAIEIDPEYALAYAGIADSSSLLYMYREATPENLQIAEESSRRALDISPDLAEAHASFGLALSLRKRWKAAAESFERALELDPRSFEAAYFYGRASLAHGDFAKAEEMFALAARNRPDDYQAVAYRVMALHSLGRSEEEREAAAVAAVAAERRIAINPGESRAYYLGATNLFIIGQRERAFEWAERAIAIDPNEVSTLYNVGCLYSLAGETTRALDNLERAVALGFAHRDWIENDSDWEQSRHDPRFQEILSRVKPEAALAPAS